MVPTAGVVIGATVAAVTYVAVAESGNAVATATHYGSYVASKIAGKGITVLFGPTSGLVAEYATAHGGQQWLAPLITGSSRRAAMMTAAAAGAAAAAVTTVVYYGASWLWDHSTKALTRVMRQPPTAVAATVVDTENDFQAIELSPPSPTAPPALPEHYDVMPRELPADV